jgi:hypothetical protein
VGFCHSRILGSPKFFGCKAKASAGTTNRYAILIGRLRTSL